MKNELLNRCRSAIKNIEPMADIILYGSRARGEENPESDYDLLILSDQKVSLNYEDMLRRQLFHIELETGAVITVMACSKKEWYSPIYRAMPLNQNIQKEGILL